MLLINAGERVIVQVMSRDERIAFQVKPTDYWQLHSLVSDFKNEDVEKKSRIGYCLVAFVSSALCIMWYLWDS